VTDILTHLGNADIFAVLNRDELECLSHELVLTELASGQDAVTQGDGGSSLFLIISGHMSVVIVDAGTPVDVGDLHEGDFFGEMSLLTGTPRSATVRAISATTLIEVTKRQLAPLMQRHDELASLMGRALSERQGSNLKTLMEFERPSAEIEKETIAAQLSWRIQKFFDLPTSIWGKAVDGIAGFSIRGPLGFVLGRSDDAASGINLSATPDDRQVAFTTAIIVLAAKMTAAGGSYSQREVTQLQEIFDIPASDMANVTRIYNRAQGNARGFEPYAQQIAELFSDQRTVLEELIGTLLRVSRSGQSGTEEMLGVIEQISGLFGFSAEEFNRLKTLNPHKATSGSMDDAPDFRTILSIPDGATPGEAKRAYHKLVMKNHPDKLISEGMPEEFIKQANDKLALINIAYEQYQAAQEAA